MNLAADLFMLRTLVAHPFLQMLALSLLSAPFVNANPLQDYVSFDALPMRWEISSVQREDWGTITHLQIDSQQWRAHSWRHHLVIVSPKQLNHTKTAFLLVAGDGDGRRHIDTLKTLSLNSGTVTAAIMNVPNQPLYEGRKEDALIAYTFNQYLQTGDDTWPLLFPMVKSVTRTMDVLQAYLQQTQLRPPEHFVVSGASKRGWTTWLTAAVDGRIKAIAPMVIDVLNMKPQLQWSEQIYGQQSVKIKDYTELNLHRKQDSPAMQKLRSWVDPYQYRHLYTMPKLLLLGTNDPYWTVDSLRHYWHNLPEPKLIYQTPNAGHNLNGGTQAVQTLSAFYQMVVNDEPLPQLNWQFDYLENHRVNVRLTSSQQPKSARLWTALSKDRDFRADQWQPQALNIHSDRLNIQLIQPEQGYKAFMLEVDLETVHGHAYKLSTEARVTPDTQPCHCWREQDQASAIVSTQ